MAFPYDMQTRPVVTFWRRAITGASCLLALGAGTACIDDPLSGEAGVAFPISERDASLLGIQALRDALLARLAADTSSRPPSGGGPTSPRTIHDTATVTIPCDLGGSVRSHVLLDGSVDSVKPAVVLTFTIEQQHQTCRELVNGSTQTTLAAPGITTSMTFISDGAELGVLGSIKGGIVLLRDGTTGSCTIDLSLSGLHRADNTGSYAVRGRVCDKTVDESVVL